MTVEVTVKVRGRRSVCERAEEEKLREKREKEMERRFEQDATIDPILLLLYSQSLPAHCYHPSFILTSLIYCPTFAILEYLPYNQTVGPSAL